MIDSVQSYRDFSCEDDSGYPTFYATISVDNSRNEITLRDVSNPVDVFTCKFITTTLNSFDFSAPSLYPTVSITIDDVKLDALYSMSHHAPLVPETSGNDFVIDVDMKSKFNSGTYSLTQTFTITDNLSQYHPRPNNPVAILAFLRDDGSDVVGGQWNSEGMSGVLDNKCEITTPTSSLFEPLTLTFNPALSVWTAPLNSINQLDAFQIKLRCSFDYKQLLFNGWDITSTQGLTLEIINIRDNIRFASSTTATGWFEREPNGTLGTPSGPVCSQTFQNQLLLSEDPIQQQYQNGGEFVDSTLRNFFTSLTFDDNGSTVNFRDYYSVSMPVQSSTKTFTPSYFQAPADFQQVQWTAAYDIQKNVYEPHILSMANKAKAPVLMSGASSTEAPWGWYGGSTLPTALFTQMVDFAWKNPTTTQTKYSTATMPLAISTQAAGDVFNANKAKVVGVDPIPGTLSRVSSTCSFYSAITTCGRVNGARAVHIDGVSGTDDFTADNWQFDFSQLCQLGDQCSMNLDCESPFQCINNVCSTPSKVETPHLGWQLSTPFHLNQFSKLYNNNTATLKTSVLLAVAVILAFIF